MDLSKKQTAAAAAVITAALAALGWWAWKPAEEANAGAGDAAVAQGPTASPFAGLPAGSMPPPDLTQPDGPQASGPDTGTPALQLSPEEQATLWEAVRTLPNARAEYARLQHYAMFQKRFERWQTLKQGNESLQERQALAQQIVDALPAHLDRGEMMAGEALLLYAAMLEDLEPDQGRREARVAKYRTELEARAKQENDSSLSRADDERKLAAYKRREAEILTQWQALPENARDKQQLMDQLEAARREVFGAQ